jgi:hypothetical protein
VQGYYYSKPLPASEATLLLRVGKTAPRHVDKVEATAAAWRFSMTSAGVLACRTVALASMAVQTSGAWAQSAVAALEQDQSAGEVCLGGINRPRLIWISRGES